MNLIFIIIEWKIFIIVLFPKCFIFSRFSLHCGGGRGGHGEMNLARIILNIVAVFVLCHIPRYLHVTSDRSLSVRELIDSPSFIDLFWIFSNLLIF